MSLEGKVVLVTGASRPRGIGRAAALALAKMGADVAVADLERAMEGAKSVAQEVAALGRKSLAVPMDVTDYATVQRGSPRSKAGLGPVSILVNNAALMGHHVTIAKTTIEEWDREVKICLNGSFYCLKEAWADMCANKWGRVINLTSVAGVLGGTDSRATAPRSPALSAWPSRLPSKAPGSTSPRIACSSASAQPTTISSCRSLPG